jgi:hypothetical protein
MPISIAISSNVMAPGAPTKGALARFGVDRLDLDENWASVWPDWE